MHDLVIHWDTVVHSNELWVWGNLFCTPASTRAGMSGVASRVSHLLVLTTMASVPPMSYKGCKPSREVRAVVQLSHSRNVLTTIQLHSKLHET